MLLAACDDSGPQLVVMNFQDEISEPHPFEDLQCFVKFRYPEFDAGPFLDIDIRADPGPSWRPSVKLQVPFSQDTSHALLVVTLWIVLEGDLQCLVQFLPSNGLSEVTSCYDREYEWEEWGPHRSRIVFPPQPHSDTWVCYVYGWKYVITEPGASEGASEHDFVARIYDFNQAAIKRNDRDTRSSWLYQRAKTVFAPGTIFDDVVETTFPYRSQLLTLKGTHKHCHALCSEDHIILVDVRLRKHAPIIRNADACIV